MQPSSLLTRFRNSLFTESSEVELKHLSPSWAPPSHCNIINIYVRKKDSYIKIRGSYDINQRCFVKTNGAALPIILGWDE